MHVILRHLRRVVDNVQPYILNQANQLIKKVFPEGSQAELTYDGVSSFVDKGQCACYLYFR